MPDSSSASKVMRWVPGRRKGPVPASEVATGVAMFTEVSAGSAGTARPSKSRPSRSDSQRTVTTSSAMSGSATVPRSVTTVPSLKVSLSAGLVMTMAGGEPMVCCSVSAVIAPSSSRPSRVKLCLPSVRPPVVQLATPESLTLTQPSGSTEVSVRTPSMSLIHR